MAKTLREKNINQIIYISLGGAIAVFILFIILFNVFANKKNNSNSNMQLGQTNSNENSIEQANSSIGKKVEDMKKYEEVNEENSVQIKIENDDENKSNEKEVAEQTDDNSNSAQNSNNNSESAQSTAQSNTDAFSDEDVNPTNSEPATQTEEPQKDPTFKMPVEGEIVKHFGKDKLIYSETLKEWTTHLGIDIKADKTAVVKAATDGVVKSIKNDPRYGLTVVLEHQNGFTSVYSNLLTAEFVVVGENVKTGQTLGTVGNSATFEILDDSHLHFEILKDGIAVDPEMYVK